MKKLITLLAIAATTATMAQNPIPTNGLIGHYPFNANANDNSGNSNNGIVHGATLTTDRFGNPNSAYYFNGVDNSISIKSGPLQSFSLSCWVYPTTIVNNNLNGIISNYYYQAYNGYELRIEPDSTVMLVCGGTSYHAVINTTNKLKLNTWYHIVATSADTTLKLYINGQLVVTGPIATPLNITPRTFIGTRDTSVANGGFFTGKIDDIREYNRELTPNEVKALYNESLCYQTVTVTDTLLIHLNVTGFNPITFANTIKLYPNPANTQITIDCGNSSNINGYQIKITNTLSQTLYQTMINQSVYTLGLNTFGGAGLYFVNIYDAKGNLIDVKKIVIQ